MTHKPFTSIWVRTAADPRAGRGPALSRAQIVREAIGLLDAEGLDALSMRRLATRLDSAATSLYWHVPGKDDLLELVLDEIWGTVRLPDVATVTWREGANVFAYRTREMIFKHPWVVTLIYTRPDFGPNAVRVTDWVQTLMEKAGFTGLQVHYAFQALTAYVIGATHGEVSWHTSAIRSGMTQQDWMAAVKAALRTASPEHRRILRRFDDLGHTTSAQQEAVSFDFGLLAVLDGLEARLRPDPPAPAHRPAFDHRSAPG
ncbi:TetR/AcrR family transcriptional regulator [Rhizohabitans arisaemae]|uniref:TetR/AcrR family transcriptional regulator n=1 Tax=Rhizohabitans arisaemae TaxID=2720610 RepID=UPI0024B22750|nr:TetR/AcrR family transcriptional regulator C-terminal domain-containing protein [Rhizohabitans arisaemae]